MLLLLHKTIFRILCLAIVCFAGFGLCQSYAQVYVGGTITENTIWEKSKSPYIVFENIQVPQDITLTVEAGVTVLVQENKLLRIEGDLIARGTSQDSIYFNSENGTWFGINLNNVHTVTDDGYNYLSGTYLSHVSIRNTFYAITLENNSSVLIDSCSFYRSSYGLYMYYTNFNLIRSNKFVDCDFAIYSASNYSSSYNRFLNNKILNSKHVAIFFNNSNGESRYNSFLGNELSGNFIGIHYGNTGPHENSNSVFSYNKISGNIYGVRIYKDSTEFEYNQVSSNLFGIELNNARFCSMRYNVVNNNRLWAVSFTGESSYNHFDHNTVRDNVRGIRFTTFGESGSQYNAITYNSFFRNSDSVVYISSSPQLYFHYNSIYDNGDSCTFINATYDTVHAEYNYWGTEDTTAINRIIFDVYDDNSSEIVLYKPFESIADNDAPISPPKDVFKKIEGDQVLVYWKANKEQDLAGYKVYFGSGLSQTINTGTDTALILPGINLIDTIAVTAFDNQADGYYDWFEGHESDFTYALIIPFAGKDTTICANEQLYLEDATAFNYHTLIWSTSGDGSFSNASALHPYYVPGVNDLLSGSATLTIAIKGDGFDFHDELIVNFRQLPAAFAGNDTLLYINSLIQFNLAVTSNVSSLYWETTGDGTFDDSASLYSIYHPGINDSISGNVSLILHGQSRCGNVTDTVNIRFIPVFNISGRVMTKNGILTDARITLSNTAGTAIKAISEEYSSPLGTYCFNYLPAGNYYLKAYPPEENKFDFVPVYFFNEILWQNAASVQLHENTYDVDLFMPEYSSLPAAGICRLRGLCRIEPDEEVCSNVDVFLYDRSLQHIVGWQTVSEDGSFLFENLPYGNYVIMAQKTGFSGIPSEVFSLTAEDPDASGLEIWLTSDKKLSFKNIPAADEAEFSLYPNPTSGIIHLTTKLTADESSFRLFGSDGSAVSKEKFRIEAGEKGYFLDFTQLASGIYILKFKKDQISFVRKILITR